MIVKKNDKIYCMHCGKELKPFYSYCIFCGASTEDNPKCNVHLKEMKHTIVSVNNCLHALKNSLTLIPDNEVHNKAVALEKKIDSLIPVIKDRLVKKVITDEEASLYNKYLPRLIELIDKYACLESPSDEVDLQELNSQLADGIESFSKTIDSINTQVFEDSITEITVDLKVLDIFLKRMR